MKIKMAEIAGRINAHLKRFEADPQINFKSRCGTTTYWHPSAIENGAWVSIYYVSYRGMSHLRRAEAEAYLAWLDAGHTGKHWECPRRDAEGSE